MHSSRMRTARLLPVSPRMHCLGVGGVPGLGRGVHSPGRRGVYLVQGGIPGPRGCTWSWGCTWSGGVYLVPRGCTWSWGVYLVRGGCTWFGGVPSRGDLVPGGVPGTGGVPGPGGCTWSGGVPAQVLSPCEQNDRQV